MSDEAKEVKNLAWEVDLNDMRCIVFAPTQSKAQYIAVRSYWEAYGRRKGEWPRAKAFRATRHDNSSLQYLKPQAYCEEYVCDRM